MYIAKRHLICSALAVPSQTTVWTNNFRFGFAVSFGIQFQCANSTTPNVKIQLEHSYLDLSDGNQGNTNQQQLTNSAYVIPDGFPDVVSNVVDNNWHIVGILPVMAYHCRYKIIGQAGNPADTTITIYNTIQEPGRSYGE